MRKDRQRHVSPKSYPRKPSNRLDRSPESLSRQSHQQRQSWREAAIRQGARSSPATPALLQGTESALTASSLVTTSSLSSWAHRGEQGRPLALELPLPSTRPDRPPTPIPISVNDVVVGDFVYLGDNPALRVYLDKEALNHPAVIAHIEKPDQVDRVRIQLLIATTFGGSQTTPSGLSSNVYNDMSYVPIHPAKPSVDGKLLYYHNPLLESRRNPAWLCVSKLYEVMASHLTYVFHRKGDKLLGESMDLVLDMLAKNYMGLLRFTIYCEGNPKRGYRLFYDQQLLRQLSKNKHCTKPITFIGPRVDSFKVHTKDPSSEDLDGNTSSSLTNSDKSVSMSQASASSDERTEIIRKAEAGPLGLSAPSASTHNDQQQGCNQKPCVTKSKERRKTW